MTLQQLRAAHQAQPFRPFTLQLADSDQVQIRHPELMMISPGGRTLVVAVSNEAFKIIDTFLITAIHVGNHRPRRRSRR